MNKVWILELYRMNDGTTELLSLDVFDDWDSGVAYAENYIQKSLVWTESGNTWYGEQIDYEAFLEPATYHGSSTKHN